MAAHGSVVLKLSNGVAATAPAFTYYAASSGTLAGGANTRSVNGSTIVGNVGNGGTLTLNNINGGTAGGTKLVSFDYINADFVISNTACSNCRNAVVSVNGGAGVTVNLPISGQVSAPSTLLKSGWADFSSELGCIILRVFGIVEWFQSGDYEYDHDLQS